MRLSRKGAAFIGRFEGFRSCPYRDPVGVWTIGYGTTHGIGPGTSCISQAKARKWLRRDAAEFAAVIKREVRVSLSQTQKDALISFTYNVGAGAFASSTLLKQLNRGDYKAVPSELAKWVHGGGQVLPGLVTRRRAEGRLFAHGHYG